MLIFADDATGMVALNRFRADRDIYVEIKGYGNLDRMEEKMIQRHLFTTRPVKHSQLWLEASEFRITEGLKTVVRNRIVGCLARQHVEDINAVGKNCSQLKACRRARKGGGFARQLDNSFKLTTTQLLKPQLLKRQLHNSFFKSSTLQAFAVSSL